MVAAGSARCDRALYPFCCTFEARSFPSNQQLNLLPMLPQVFVPLGILTGE